MRIAISTGYNALTKMLTTVKVTKYLKTVYKFTQASHSCSQFTQIWKKDNDNEFRAFIQAGITSFRALS